MKLIPLEPNEVDLLALVLMTEEDREWKRIADPRDMGSVESLRRLLLKLPARGQTAVAVRHHCKTRRLTYP